MNLQQALDVVSSPLLVRGFSDHDLAEKINKTVPPGGVTFSAIPMLHGDRIVRPVDVLLRLAAATRPRYQMELYDVHAHWSLLRYLGLFDADGARRLVLSAAGRRVVGNQRRVTSEELGIGFAVYLAEEWTKGRLPGTLTVRSVDIDVALTSGFVSASGLRLLVEQAGVKRPDYLLISQIGGSGSRFSISLIECKGTSSRRYASQQLAHAATQLDSVVVGGRRPSGLVVSTVVAQYSTAYFALESHPERAAERRTEVSDSALRPRPAGDEVQAYLGEVPIEELPDVDLDQAWPVDASRFTATALRGSWAMLADLAGNDQAFQRWAPAAMRNRLGRTADDRPQRVHHATDGFNVVGVRNIISLPGGQLEAIVGVEAEVDEALTDGDATDVLAAQQRIIRRELPYLHRQRRTSSVVSIADDGSALVLNPVKA